MRKVVYTWADMTPNQRQTAIYCAQAVHHNFADLSLEWQKIMIAIAGAESSMNPNTVGDKCSGLTGNNKTVCNRANCLGYASHGLWQIFMGWHWDKIVSLGGPDPRVDGCGAAAWLRNINNSAQVARMILNTSGPGAWTVYNNSVTGKIPNHLQWMQIADMTLWWVMNHQDGEQPPPNYSWPPSNGGNNGEQPPPEESKEIPWMLYAVTGGGLLLWGAWLMSVKRPPAVPGSSR